MMLISQSLKQHALRSGADLVGIANIERFDGAPPDHDPRSLLPEAKSVIVVALRQHRGTLRGIEEGVDWWAYDFISYGGINMMFSIACQRSICSFLEDYGFEGVPYIHTGSKELAKRRVTPDRPLADITLSPRVAGVLAGLGEIGLSQQFLTPEFGPRQRLFIILTDAELDPDPIFDGKICDKCGLCIKACPGDAYVPGENDDLTLQGRTYPRAKLDLSKCAVCHHGGLKKNSPFINQDVEGADRLYDPKLLEVPYYEIHNQMTHHLAMCGAKGCIRACMMHLEEQKRIKNLFRLPFRRRPAWDEQADDQNVSEAGRKPETQDLPGHLHG